MYVCGLVSAMAAIGGRTGGPPMAAARSLMYVCMYVCTMYVYACMHRFHTIIIAVCVFVCMYVQVSHNNH
jgi:hypothetical protein